MSSSTAPAPFERFVPLIKVNQSRREVWGIIAEEAPDQSGEVLDYASSKPYFQAWSERISKASGGKSLGNVRAMHGKTAAGKLIALDFYDDVHKVGVGARVVDDDEWEKVLEGVYTGFSIGGDYVRRWRDQSGFTRYTAAPVEVSLVDNPAMYGALFEVIKQASPRGEVLERVFKRFVGGSGIAIEANETRQPESREVSKVADEQTDEQEVEQAEEVPEVQEKADVPLGAVPESEAPASQEAEQAPEAQPDVPAGDDQAPAQEQVEGQDLEKGVIIQTTDDGGADAVNHYITQAMAQEILRYLQDIDAQVDALYAKLITGASPEQMAQLEQEAVYADADGDKASMAEDAGMGGDDMEYAARGNLNKAQVPEDVQKQSAGLEKAPSTAHGDVTKAMEIVLQQQDELRKAGDLIKSLEARIEKLENEPAPGGPVLTAAAFQQAQNPSQGVSKALAPDIAAENVTTAAAPSYELTEEALLRKLIAETTDPHYKEALGRQLAMLKIKQVQSSAPTVGGSGGK